MTKKEMIADGESTLAENIRLVESIELIEKNYDHEKAVRLLLSMHKDGLLARNRTIESKLPKLKADYIKEFEFQSSECNSNMDRLIDACNSLILAKRGIPAILELLPPLIKRYADEKHKISQEEKNMVYFELKQHWTILIKSPASNKIKR